MFPTIIPAATRRAMRLAGQVIVKAAKKNWKDMGLYTLTFFAFLKPNGKIVVET